MARPQKDIVDYFPHDANASGGDTLTILEGQWGNDGYVFWFKLLERLASTDGHFIDCKNSKKWQLLLARARVDENTGVEMMKLLVEMGSIDKQLWEWDKIVWSQNLVDNVAEVYRNRRRELPQKPVSTGLKLITTGNNPETTTDNPQTKVKETKVKETKEESVVDEIIITKESVLDVFKEEIAGIREEESLSEYVERDVEDAIRRFTAPWVIDAIREGVRRKARSWRYITTILSNWKRFGKDTKNKGSPKNQDPDKYIKGKYGHLVKR